MISEPDRAVLNKLGEKARGKPQIAETLGRIKDKAKLRARFVEMQAASPSWIVVVKPTTERPWNWWLEVAMYFFRDGISTVYLSDGRFAVCTWAASA